MKRITKIALAAVLATALFALAGCSTAEKGGMKVWGYVAAAKNAQLDVNESQRGTENLLVDRVLSPGDAWLVVHADDNGKPGTRVGLKHIKAGETKKVWVPLTPNIASDKVIVAVHADQGTKGTFDFDMMKKEMSPDRPYFVNEKELAKVIAIR